MATNSTEQIVSQPNDLEHQDTQQSNTPQLAQTLVDLNQTMSHMAMLLGDLWQKSQDTNVPLQQPDVEESQHRRRGKKRCSKTSSSSSEASSGSGNESRGRKCRKRRSHSKTRLENRGEMTNYEQGKCLKMLKLPAMILLATIAENRWNKKLAPEKLTLIQEKYKRPANCTTVCSLTVNPEIWAKLPHYQQRADLNVSKIQVSVRKAALISLQTAHSLTNTKSNELDVKQLLTQRVDSLVLFGHISYELACLRRYKIKSVLKPEYASICVVDGTQSKYLFRDDLPKRLKDAKEASNVGLAVNMSNSRNNYWAPKSYDQRNWRQTRGGHNYHAGTSQSDFFHQGKSNYKGKKVQNTNHLARNNRSLKDNKFICFSSK
ncbi:Hypothetical predicted protein [Paramuricea clavata]|uniref:Uncharacterized protein n=1 Tax=Paramuricea clavata TaxID=317549 RepID=A0A6S7FYG6_PARCT|nr:Hypothetical predicted protein [Paramuricea clavata]